MRTLCQHVHLVVVVIWHLAFVVGIKTPGNIIQKRCNAYDASRKSSDLIGRLLTFVHWALCASPPLPPTVAKLGKSTQRCPAADLPSARCQGLHLIPATLQRSGYCQVQQLIMRSIIRLERWKDTSVCHVITGWVPIFGAIQRAVVIMGSPTHSRGWWERIANAEKFSNKCYRHVLTVEMNWVILGTLDLRLLLKAKIQKMFCRKKNNCI